MSAKMSARKFLKQHQRYPNDEEIRNMLNALNADLVALERPESTRDWLVRNIRRYEMLIMLHWVLVLYPHIQR